MVSTIRVRKDGTVERDVKVPHRAANIACNAVIGQRKDFDSGTTYDLRCKRLSGHPTPKGAKRHKAVDIRYVAAPYPVVRTRRFAPGGIPKGVDLNITLPHDCANHLADVEEVARGWT